MFLIRRDFKALREMFGIAFGWLVLGAKIRRRYRAHRRAGSIYWIDQDELLS